MVLPNGPFPFLGSVLMFSGCRAVMPNGLSVVQCLMSNRGRAEWSFSLLLFNLVMPNGHLFSVVRCLIFKGSRVVSRMAIFFICSMIDVQ